MSGNCHIHVSAQRFIEIVSSCQENEFLERYLDISARTLCQCKCMEILKWNLSYREHKDIGKAISDKLWSELGYSEAFAEVYDVDKTIEQMYNEIEAIVQRKKECQTTPPAELETKTPNTNS